MYLNSIYITRIDYHAVQSYNIFYAKGTQIRSIDTLMSLWNRTKAKDLTYP
jgi:hypothetical protein